MYAIHSVFELGAGAERGGKVYEGAEANEGEEKKTIGAREIWRESGRMKEEEEDEEERVAKAKGAQGEWTV